MAKTKFDVNKISSKQQRQLKETGSFTDRMNRQRSSDGSVVGGAPKSSGVDLSQIRPDVKNFDEPSTDLKDLSIAFSGQASAEQMAGFESSNPELAKRAAAATAAAAGAPEGFVEYEPEEEAPGSEFAKLSTSLQAEITAIEERMAGREQDRTDLYDEAGVFDDMQQLNALKAEKMRLEDREIEIPIEGRDMLRGRMATKTDFNQLTRPALEKNLLSSLAASRNVSRMTDVINTNIAVIDQRLKAKSDQDEFLYKQKIDRLAKVETIYGNIMTETQKAAAAEKKFEYDLILEGVKSDSALRSDLIKEIAKRGTGGLQLEGLMDASIDELVSFQGEQISVKNWSTMSEEEAAMTLSKDDFSKYETYKEWEKTATAEEKAAGDQAIAITQSAEQTIDLIEGMLDDEAGLKTSVGFGLGNKDITFFWGGVGNESAQFRAKGKQLLSQATLDKLLELKAAGGTLGAISEKELDILANAATAFGSITDENGKATGRFEFDEEEFKTALETMRSATMKTHIAANIGKEAYAAAGYQFLDGSNEEDFKIIEDRYNQIKEDGLTGSVDYAEQEIRSEPNLETAFNLIRPEEGFRSEAYQDVAGVWTVGYGNTRINGRPVQPGDRVTREEGESLMRSSVIENHTNFADTVTSEITPNQFAALTSFEYNLGGGVWQTNTGSRILSLVNEGRMSEAGQLMLQYNKARDPQTGQLVMNRGLANRRAREADLLLT